MSVGRSYDNERTFRTVVWGVKQDFDGRHQDRSAADLYSLYGMVRMGVIPGVNALSTIILAIALHFVSTRHRFGHK